MDEVIALAIKKYMYGPVKGEERGLLSWLFGRNKIAVLYELSRAWNDPQLQYTIARL